MTTTRSDNSESAPVERMEYEPPCVLSEEAFETLALSCAKIGDDLFCESMGPTSS